MIVIVSIVTAQDTVTVKVFSEKDIKFDGQPIHTIDSVTHSDAGRIISRTMALPMFDYPVKISAHLIIKSHLAITNGANGDPWDRAGNVYFSNPGMENVELLKFCTGFGGVSNLTQDVTDLAPLLQGEVTINGFVDTWVNPAWQMDFELIFTRDESVELADWSKGIYFTTGMVTTSVTDTTPVANITVPESNERIKLVYYTSGHSINGNRDEFYTKDNVLYIDNEEIYRFSPWRTDCGNFKSRNPYSGSWYDGGQKVYSYELDRSGWCPGDKVYPVVLDITEYVEPGQHEVRFAIENITKQGDAYGYWRVSSYLSGWGEINNWTPSRMEITGPGDRTILQESVLAMRIDLYDDFGNILPKTEVQLSVDCMEDSIYFSTDNDIWENSLNLSIDHGAVLFWVRPDAVGNFSINVYESGTSNGLDTANYKLTVNDLEVDENDYNYALIANATADAECNSSTETAFHAIDGDLTTKWCANDGAPNWLEVSFDTPVSLNYFIIRHAGAGNAPVGDPGNGDNSSMNLQDFKIQKNVDGNWQDIVVITGNPTTEEGDVTYHYLGSPVEFDRVRLYTTNPDVARLYEFEMYNLDEAVAIEEELVKLVEKFELGKNYPNPFNGTTNIEFFLPQYGNIEGFVFNIKGQLVSKLISGKFNRGYHTVKWNGKGLHGEALPSGVYFVNVKFYGNDITAINRIQKITYLK